MVPAEEAGEGGVGRGGKARGGRGQAGEAVAGEAKEVSISCTREAPNQRTVSGSHWQTGGVWAVLHTIARGRRPPAPPPGPQEGLL